MNPKEKAIELVRQFYSIGADECKQCALIAVDEIIKTLKPPCLNEYSYWQEVKSQIQTL